MPAVDDVAAHAHPAPVFDLAAPSEQGREPITFSLSTSSPAVRPADVLVIGAFADGTLSPPARAVDAASRGRLCALVRRGDLDEKAGSSLVLYDLPGVAATRVLLVSLGGREGFGDKAFFE